METRSTSIECYNQIKNENLLSKRRMEVYEAVFKCYPCTSFEAELHLNKKGFRKHISNIRARMVELRDMGVIYERDIRECSVTGRKVTEWAVSGKFPQELPAKKTTKQKAKELKGMLKELKESASDLFISSKIEEINLYLEKEF